MRNIMLMTDAYKLDHRRQYPSGTQYVYSNFTPRSSRITGVNKVKFFGLQYFTKHYLTDLANETFFNKRRGLVLTQYHKMLNSVLGPNDIGIDHIADLYDLGYIPLRFKALPEGTSVPLRVPMFTIENTLPEFFWLTNYFETLLSSVLWLGCTSATTADLYKRLLLGWAKKTSGDKEFVNWQGHDFSFRGMENEEAAALSGAGHLLSFTGTDTIPAIQLINDYYGGNHVPLVGGSVAATEHSVMCAGGCDGEKETFERLLNLYPSGILSVVSDTWDLWAVIEQILPQLKDKIMARNGKLVIRPDSGDPVDILCGTISGLLSSISSTSSPRNASEKGVIELLWDKFGGTINAQGFKQLNSHIGAIYGDSITLDRAQQICERLAAKGFASTNVVLGIGSYTYQYVTRDTYGFAVKATWCQINDKETPMFKDPKTDSGVKKSAKGRMAVVTKDKELSLVDNLTLKTENEYFDTNELQLVWKDGIAFRHETINGIRARMLDDITGA